MIIESNRKDLIPGIITLLLHTSPGCAAGPQQLGRVPATLMGGADPADLAALTPARAQGYACFR